LGRNGRANPAIGYRVALPTVNRKTQCKESKKLHLTPSGSARRRANATMRAAQARPYLGGAFSAAGANSSSTCKIGRWCSPVRLQTKGEWKHQAELV